MRRPTVLLLFIALPAMLSAQEHPRRLSQEELARLRDSVEKSREDSALAAQRTAASRQQEEQRRQEQLAQQAWDPHAAHDEQIPVSAPAPGMFEAFLGGFQSEVDKQRQQDAQQQRFLDDLRRQADAVHRQRQQEQERQRLADEHARQQLLARRRGQQQTMPDAAGGTGRPGQQATTTTEAMSAPQQAARAREERLRVDAGAERQRQQQLREQQQADQAEWERRRAADEAAADDRQRNEEQRRLAAAQAVQQAEHNLKATFRGAAVTCPGGGKDVLYLRTSSPPKTGCDVSFEARCPGTTAGNGAHFSQTNYIGASCGFGDNIRIGTMDCPADQVSIRMLQASCG